jgi:hypothetical protein
LDIYSTVSFVSLKKMESEQEIVCETKLLLCPGIAGAFISKVAMVGMTIATIILAESQCRSKPVLPSVPPHPLFCPLTSYMISIKENSTIQDAGLPQGQLPYPD